MACWVQPEEEQVPTFYENITQPHVASFDFFLSEGMRTVVDLLQPIEVRGGGGGKPGAAAARQGRCLPQ